MGRGAIGTAVADTFVEPTMSVRTFAFSYTLLPALAIAAMFACSRAEEATPDDDETSDGGIHSDPPETGTDVDLQFQPKAAFSGFDGAHAFVFPIAVYGAKGEPTITASDPSALEIVKAKLTDNDPDFPDDGRYYLVTAKKAGTFTLTATSDGASKTAMVTVTPYDAARYAAGEARYKNGTTGAAKPCTECHNAEAGAPDHSPASIAGVDDARVATVIRTGRLANGIPIVTGSGEDHIWTASDAELDGLVTYLRALPQTKVVPER